MALKVQYLRDADDLGSECWAFIPFTESVQDAKCLARDALRDVSAYLGATSFRIVNSEGDVMATEAITAASRALLN